MTERNVGAGRTGDVGADTADGHDPSVGGSTQGGDHRDVQPSGDGQASREAGAPTPSGDPDQAAGPTSGTPDDLKPGTRRTVGLDPDDGAGEGDLSGTESDKLENG